MTTSSQIRWAERIDQLKEYVAQGFSRQQIADRMQLTRSAVSGKIHRLHLVSPPREISSAQPRKRKPSQRKKKKPTATILTMPPRPHWGACHPVSLYIAGPNDCRAVVDHDDNGIAIFCGNTKCIDAYGKQSSFCADHHAIFCAGRWEPKL